jgi:hypothetical protein
MTRRIGLVAALGVGLGVFSAVGDGIVFLAAPANAVGPWIVAAFAAGVVAGHERSGAIFGALALVVAVVTYYVGVRLMWGDAFIDPLRASAVWGAVAILVGAPLGLAGGAWAGGDERWRVPSVAVLSGLLFAEAIARFVEVEGWTGIDLGRSALQVWLIDATAAIIAPLVLLDRQRWAAAYICSVVVGVLGAAVLAASLSLIRSSATGA